MSDTSSRKPQQTAKDLKAHNDKLASTRGSEADRGNETSTPTRGAEESEKLPSSRGASDYDDDDNKGGAFKDFMTKVINIVGAALIQVGVMKIADRFIKTGPNESVVPVVLTLVFGIVLVGVVAWLSKPTNSMDD
jgi:hypothetical protein